MNICHAVDFYKTGHGPQYPAKTEFVSSNLTPRSAKYANSDRITVFGPQRFIGKRLIEGFNKDFFDQPLEKVLRKYKRRMDNALGPNVVSTDQIKDLHNLGFMPMHIKALPEGVSVLPGIPVMTMINTNPKFFWLTNYLETILSCEIWQPMTNISIAREYLKILTKAALRTGTPVEFVPWQGHDFSMRGMAGIEAAAASSAAHLAAGFYGTDTVMAIDELEDWYGADSDKEMVGGSVVATEHAVMCMGTKDDEIGTFARLIAQYQYGILSIVSDTWNLWTVLTEYAPALKAEIEARKDVLDPDGNLIQPAKVVFRPDSGNPVKILTGYKYKELQSKDLTVVDDGDTLTKLTYTDTTEVVKVNGKYYKLEFSQGYRVLGNEMQEPEVKGVVQLLWDEFGGEVNEAGFKQLTKVGAIYGDSITLERAEQIMDRLADKGFASGNVVLGIGSFTYQYNTRDTFGMAVKATYGVVDGVPRNVFKDPITDDGTKKSATGLLRVELENGEYVLYDKQTPEQEKGGELQTIFLNGKARNLTTLAEIRARVAETI
jgi:nicotinamide phosphoribosyltransferase